DRRCARHRARGPRGAVGLPGRGRARRGGELRGSVHAGRGTSTRRPGVAGVLRATTGAVGGQRRQPATRGGSHPGRTDCPAVLASPLTGGDREDAHADGARAGPTWSPANVPSASFWTPHRIGSAV